MENDTIIIGILDDDPSKITNIKGRLRHKYKIEEFNDNEKIFALKQIELYKNYTIKIISLTLDKHTDATSIVTEVKQNNIDCLIIDYKLNSFVSTYLNNGVELSKQILQHLNNFPLLILTSYEEELNQKEIFEPFQIVDYIAFTHSKSYSLMITNKLIDTVISYNKNQTSLEEELKTLIDIPYEKRNAEIDSRILKIDSQLEHRICGESAIPEKLKKDLNENKFEDLLNKLDTIIRKYENDDGK